MNCGWMSLPYLGMVMENFCNHQLKVPFSLPALDWALSTEAMFCVGAWMELVLGKAMEGSEVCFSVCQRTYFLLSLSQLLFGLAVNI